MLWIFSFVSFFLSEPNLPQIRETYKSAITNESSLTKLIEITQPYLNQSATSRAFYAMGKALEARNATWVSTKLSNAKIAYNQLNTSVSKAPNDGEIRYLRFSFESKTPSMLNMRAHVKEDKAFLLKNIKSSEPLWSIMKAFFNNCDDLTAAEKKSLITR
jgi:hypothetical protein